jgi:N-acetylmuramoyl-L-alanine amidase
MTPIIHDRPAHPNNYGSRGDETPVVVVLHADASPSLSATIDWLESPKAKVSYHVSVGRSGWCCRHVPDDKSAYHAGVSALRGKSSGRSVNRFSLGLNMSNAQDGVEAFTEEQLDAAALVVHEWVKAYSIPLLNIVTHAQVALPKGRKADPWPGAPGSMTDLTFRVQELAGT